MSSNAACRLSVLSTYRRLLRLHQHLPPQMQEMGTGFVRNEFKNHKNASEEHSRNFMKEWMDYARDLEKQLKVPHSEASHSDVRMGKCFSSADLDLLSDDQLIQLYKLQKEATKPHSQ